MKHTCIQKEGKFFIQELPVVQPPPGGPINRFEYAIAETAALAACKSYPCEGEGWKQGPVELGKDVRIETKIWSPILSQDENDEELIYVAVLVAKETQEDLWPLIANMIVENYLAGRELTIGTEPFTITRKQ
jgi:hypothetical protein